MRKETPAAAAKAKQAAPVLVPAPAPVPVVDDALNVPGEGSETTLKHAFIQCLLSRPIMTYVQATALYDDLVKRLLSACVRTAVIPSPRTDQRVQRGEPKKRARRRASATVSRLYRQGGSRPGDCGL